LVPPLRDKDRHLLRLVTTERGGKAHLGNDSEAPQVGKENATENYNMSRKIVKMTRGLLYLL